MKNLIILFTLMANISTYAQTGTATPNVADTSKFMNEVIKHYATYSSTERSVFKKDAFDALQRAGIVSEDFDDDEPDTIVPLSGLDTMTRQQAEQLIEPRKQGWLESWWNWLRGRESNFGPGDRQ